MGRSSTPFRRYWRCVFPFLTSGRGCSRGFGSNCLFGKTAFLWMRCHNRGGWTWLRRNRVTGSRPSCFGKGQDAAASTGIVRDTHGSSRSCSGNARTGMALHLTEVARVSSGASYSTAPTTYSDPFGSKWGSGHIEPISRPKWQPRNAGDIAGSEPGNVRICPAASRASCGNERYERLANHTQGIPW